MTARRSVLVTGGAGLLGGALIGSAPDSVHLHATVRRTPVGGVETHRVDLADAGAVAELFARVRPQVVLHAAVGTADGERDIVQASANVAAACATIGAELVHVSTDQVFDGEHAPYAETDAPAPVLPYGEQKARAERRVLDALPDAAVIRTSLILGVAPPSRNVAWVLDAVAEQGSVALFSDELRCPIAVGDLAAQIWELLELPRADRSGAWHLVGPEAVSRATLGVLIAAAAGLDSSAIRGVPSPRPSAGRPRDLRLLTGRADRMLRHRPRPIGELFTTPTSPA